MASMPTPNARRDRARASPPPDIDLPDLDALRAENEQLRELVAQLSEIVVRRALDRK
jgi:hypothetical protein